MATAPPVLVWQPSGGVPIHTPAPPQVGYAAGERGITVLIEDQAYVDVVFVTTQPRSDWTFGELQIFNTADDAPLNIWPGIVTVKSRNGFRLYLNGLPDSGNYYLDWSINGGTLADAGTATEYTLSGPDSGPIGVATSFTVALPMGTIVDEPVTVTPDDGGVGGTFAPLTVELTTEVPSANFTYTPASYGDVSISTTNDELLSNPDPITFTSVVASYLFSGPSSGLSGVASTNFTVALPAGGVTLSTITVTPNDGIIGTGTFTPTTVGLTTAAPSATFTYTPTTAGAKPISVTNNRGLTDPGGLTYTVTAPFAPTDIAGLKLWLKADAIAGPPADGTLLSAWNDSSGNAYNLGNTGGTARPTFKTGIVNGKPVVRFDGVANYLNNAANPTVTQPNSVFVVAKQPAAGTNARLFQSNGPTQNELMVLLSPSSNLALYCGSVVQDAINHSGAFHVFAGVFNGASSAGYVDGSSTCSGSVGTDTITGVSLMKDPGTAEWDAGDIAEVVFYNSALGTTDRTNVTNYLKTKYAIP